MKIKMQNIKYFWQKLRSNWKTKYRLLIKDHSTHADIFSFRLSPRNIFVVVITSAFLLIILTAMLIAFTPLRVYVPGYTNPDEYRLYRKMIYRVDSLANIHRLNQQYLDNLYNVINEIIVVENVDEKATTVEPRLNKSKREVEKAEKQVLDEAEQLFLQINDRNSKTMMPLAQRATFSSLTLSPPTIGTIIEEYNPSKNHYGIDIKNDEGTLITAIADGVVIFAGYTPFDGNVLIIQHSGDVISVYKSNRELLKNVGGKVKLGMPVATMGKSSNGKESVHLHFELWYNGYPLNPINYISIK